MSTLQGRRVLLLGDTGIYWRRRLWEARAGFPHPLAPVAPMEAQQLLSSQVLQAQGDR